MTMPVPCWHESISQKLYEAAGVRPYYSDDNCIIIHADCRDILPMIDPGTVDLVLTDPPYGVGFDYGTGYDDSRQRYIDFLWPIAEACEKAVRDGGLVGIYQSSIHARNWSEWFPRQWELIALTKNFTQLGREFLPKSTDYVLLWPKTEWPKRKDVKSWQPNNARNWIACNTAAIRKGPEREHPCPRPLDGVRGLVSNLCPPGGLILDPFIGSGTTAVAALQLGRRCIGIEEHEEFCDVAVRRIEATRASLVEDAA